MTTSIVCQTSIKTWSEIPFHEMSEAGKLSRASIVNTLSGDIEGEGVLEYLLAYPKIAGDDVIFTGMERIVAKMAARDGSFVLRHEGVFSASAGVSGSLTIIEGSGSGDFTGIRGQGQINAKKGEHGAEYNLILETIV
ncbi:DUF3224 domain-containing protein [Iodobacter sp. CM08]|uniref:DUF3224 domain-containing protein n=1 Tax=Iodobacter sp. CM08 TaxID=3085902 RepID=UPI0029819FEE|nr:DUF3224 domain-containing protein [Iodobacter sp. CM08]MDW5418492.1 DUF3224 domain-containing protein [Iodobacter sp. CM08]